MGAFRCDGVFALAGVPLTDIDPFALGIRSGNAAQLSGNAAAAAVLIAASSNNVLKAADATGFAGLHAALRLAAGFAPGGAAAACWITG